MNDGKEWQLALPEFLLEAEMLLAKSEECLSPLQLHDEALDALHNCLTLLAWQLELIDTKTGKLGLDETEQTVLIATVVQHIPQSDFGYKQQHRPYAI